MSQRPMLVSKCESFKEQCCTLYITNIKCLNEYVNDNLEWPPFLITTDAASKNIKRQLTWSECSRLHAYFLLHVPKLRIPQIAAPHPSLHVLHPQPLQTIPAYLERRPISPDMNHPNAPPHIPPTLSHSNRSAAKRSMTQRLSEPDSCSEFGACRPPPKRWRSDNYPVDLHSKRSGSNSKAVSTGKETVSQTIATITVDSSRHNSHRHPASLKSSRQTSRNIDKGLHSSNQDFKTTIPYSTVSCRGPPTPAADADAVAVAPDFVRSGYESEPCNQHLEQDDDDQRSTVNFRIRRHPIQCDIDERFDDFRSGDNHHDEYGDDGEEAEEDDDDDDDDDGDDDDDEDDDDDDDDGYAFDRFSIRGFSPARRPAIPVEDENCQSFVGNMSKGQFVSCCEGFLQKRMDECPHYDLPSAKDDVSAFFGITVPAISVRNYVERLVKYAHSSNSTFVVMLIYIERIEKKEPRLQLNNHNMHRIAISALMIACKLLDDRVFSSAHYARVGGVPSAVEMITLERLFMRYIGHKLYVNDMMYNEMVNTLEKMGQNQPINNQHTNQKAP